MEYSESLNMRLTISLPEGIWTLKESSSPGRTEAATAARIQLGRDTDSEVIKEIKEKPGILTYQIARLLGVSIGRIDGSVTRLAERGEIDIQYALREGRLVKELYPKGFVVPREPKANIDKDLF
jgi:hypothetical protein